MLKRNIPWTFAPLICFFLFALSPQSQAADVPLEQLEKIQQFYRNLTSLSFDFKQITNSNGRTREGAGNSIFYRSSSTSSGIMRWDYNKPGKQIILNDGKELSIYTKKDKQLLIMSAKKMQSDITYSFFVGQGDLKEDFNLLPADSRFTRGMNAQSDIAVQLIPKQPHGQIKSLHFWFDKDLKIRRLLMEDHFETTTDLIFKNIKFNELPADSSQTISELVRLNLPSDTEIIRQ
ncbi:MAG: outer membrane lipoprotein carrier protein LolA [Candidatus Electrothrix sp. AX5]|jgi:outer membrane lipoprotein carrier protein|uniref:Outer membrane lipoprotein carrier protein n=1 Tax=Candidatus Electrothrix aarhusensis TaxID=1859131 RepID=A0A444IUG6_9BACT|nr:outer membrane lipoprotein carrier protein LolA [Candidatus Electrothrix sp. AX5]RWX44486.1 outer membrane lipoprotein carrier protein [Candidatus Electrothrix aarhusensis]